MLKGQFEQVYEKLTPRRKEVLKRFLAGESDRTIADSLYITKTTVRQHLSKSCLAFGLKNDFPDDRTSQRHNLVALFAKYKPELVGQETTAEENLLNKGLQPLAPPGSIEGKVNKKCDGGDRNFVGREKAIADLNTLIQQGTRCILILSPGGVGKTVLAERYLQQRFQTVVRFDIAKERQNVSSAESLVEEKLRSLGEEPGREFGVSLDRLRTKLESERIGVLVDNLEPALGEGGRFIENHRSYVDLMRVLSGSSVGSLTLITSREKVAENLDIEVYPLERLSLAAWEEYFQQKAIDTNTSDLGEMHEAYQGNALAMKMLRSRIAADHDHSIEDYWRFHRTQEGVVVEQAIANLIIEQFNRLQQVCPTAYQLLYRMGCFRFQDVPTVPREGLLSLLWGVPEHEGLRAIRDLGDRGLLERVNGEYKLHPLIRQEAVKRLQDSEDWEQANRTAAAFWTDWVESIETVDQLLQCFEAYYHYFAIDDYKQCSEVIVQSKNSGWRDYYLQEGEQFNSISRRFGIYSKFIAAILNIQDKNIDQIFNLRLLMVLGENFWIKGDIHQSIQYYEESYLRLSNNEIQNRLSKQEHKSLSLGSQFSKACCLIDLGDIENGINILEKVKESAIEWEMYVYVIESSFVLSFCYSYLKHEKLKDILEEHYIYYDKYHKDLSPWAIVHREYFLGETYKNLADYAKAEQQYHEAISKSEEMLYSQVQGKSLRGLAEVYRIQIQKDKKKVFRCHTQSIEILEKLGAKCDLAEAYYQLGLTYQETGELAQSQDYFNRAIKLWEKINAPKQVARVRGAMGNEQ